MIGDVARVAVGAPAVAVALVSVPWLTRHKAVAAGLSLPLAAGVVWPWLPATRGWVLLILTVAASFAFVGLARPTGTDARRDPPWPALGARGLALVVLLAASAGAARDAAKTVLESDGVWFGIAMGLFAVPIGGQVVAWALRPYQQQLARRTDGLIDAGRAIGWLERAVLFVLFVAGQPEAAGLALAAKTVARFPQLQREEEPFAEYVLVGTLASIVVAGVCAVVTRLAFDMPPL